MSERAKYEAVMAVAFSTLKGLLEAGCDDDDFAHEMFGAIERKAGSYLPPIKGVLNVALQDTKVN